MANSRLGLRTRPGLIRSYTEITSGDPDANAFISAAGLTDATQKNAINQLVVDLKAYNIWSKMKAIYPFVGGTADTHKWNLKDARDLDAAYRLVFAGGITHSSTGVLFNGTTGYGDTKLKPSILTQDDTHLSIYSRTNNNPEAIDIGAAVGAGFNPRFLIQLRYGATDLFATDMYESSTARVSSTNTNSTGFYVSTRTANNVFKAFKNNAQIGSTNTGASGTLSNVTNNVYIGALNGVSIFGYSSREYAFASIGDGLTDTEATDLYTAVNTFQTTLSRNV